MIEALTGVFSGIISGIIVAILSKLASKGFNFNAGARIVVVGSIVGLIAACLGATFLTRQEWLLTVVVLALFAYGGNIVWRRLDGRVRIDRERLFVWALNWTTAVYITLFLVALFLWFLPFLFGDKFMVWDYEYDDWVFRWFAMSVSRNERDAFGVYIIFGFPLMAVFLYYALAGAGTRGPGNE